MPEEMIRIRSWIRIRIHWSEVRIRGSGSAQKCPDPQHFFLAGSRIRIRIILGCWIRISMRVKSQIRIRIKVKNSEAVEPHNGGSI